MSEWVLNRNNEKAHKRINWITHIYYAWNRCYEMDFCIFLFMKTGMIHFLWRDLWHFVRLDEFSGFVADVCFLLVNCRHGLCVIDWPCETRHQSTLIGLRLYRCISQWCHLSAEWISNTWPAAPLRGVISRNCFVNKAARYRPRINAFSIHVFAGPLTLFNGAKWIWLWLMNRRAPTDPSFNPYLPTRMRLTFYRVKRRTNTAGDHTDFLCSSHFCSILLP